MYNLLTRKYQLIYDISLITMDIFRNFPEHYEANTSIKNNYFNIQCIKGNGNYNDHLIIRSTDGKIIQLVSPDLRRSEHISKYEKEYQNCSTIVISSNYVERSCYIANSSGEIGYHTYSIQNIPELDRPDIEEYIFQQSVVDDNFDYKLFVALMEPLLKNPEELYFWDRTPEEVLIELLNELKVRCHELIIQ